MAQMIRKNGPYTEPDAKVLFAQIVSAIEYLHGIDVAHRDLKPENVLLNHQNKVKVADFGLADYCRDSRDGRRVLSHTRCGTKMYMPPEVLKNPKDGYNAIFFDIWSMGGVLHYMLTGLVPFDGKQRTEIVKQQLARDIVMFRPRHLLMSSTSVKILIQKILEPDVLKRARISVIKRSEWLAGT
ncbi:testis-specific serine/threonine-protein kinase 1-like [Daktulosphaira vitifoliae]|uniref:testis-specific serine/threonine-protein kinase 1-like n=1 Tax=Daktulosphaira vitifoliae TaxID=58002 RepID=UPI0021AA7410|nr:testis-specific serine/threonine-protein kinase 1-like [Daktulosphaira vitifoliae]